MTTFWHGTQSQPGVEFACSHSMRLGMFLPFLRAYPKLWDKGSLYNLFQDFEQFEDGIHTKNANSSL